MQTVTVETANGPIWIDSFLGNVKRPVRVMLGKGIFSMTVFLSVEQASEIAAAIASAIADIAANGEPA
jgi:hypothetical protein